MLSPRFNQAVEPVYMGSMDSNRYDTPNSVASPTSPNIPQTVPPPVTELPFSSDALLSPIIPRSVPPPVVDTPEYIEEQYEGNPAANPFRIPVFSADWLPETGEATDELIRDGGAYFLSYAPDTTVYVPSYLNVGVGPDASDTERISELNDPRLARTTTFNDDSIRGAVAEFQSWRQGNVFDAKLRLTDPEEMVYSPDRDYFNLSRGHNKVWYRDESGEKVYSSINTSSVNLSRVPASVADAFTMGPEDIEALYVIAPDNSVHSLDEYTEEEFKEILRDPQYSLEVRWRKY